jgi:hypothetical protein
MSVKLENVKVTNKTKGRATELLAFDANLGAISIKGCTLVKLDGTQLFVSFPHNRFKGDDGKWKTFRYIGLNGDRGNKLNEEILNLAKEEYKRRAAASQARPAPAAPAPTNQSFGYEDEFDSELGF